MSGLSTIYRPFLESLFTIHRSFFLGGVWLRSTGQWPQSTGQFCRVCLRSTDQFLRPSYVLRWGDGRSDRSRKRPTEGLLPSSPGLTSAASHWATGLEPRIPSKHGRLARCPRVGGSHRHGRSQGWSSSLTQVRFQGPIANLAARLDTELTQKLWKDTWIIRSVGIFLAKLQFAHTPSR